MRVVRWCDPWTKGGNVEEPPVVDAKDDDSMVELETRESHTLPFYGFRRLWLQQRYELKLSDFI